MNNREETVLSIDIGTTSISGMLFNVKTKVCKAFALPNQTAVPSETPGEKLQDPELILHLAKKVARTLLNGEPPTATAVTGQMHGILYLDKAGRPVSPLYTWQDQCGNKRIGRAAETYAQRLSQQLNMPIYTGYGLCTHAVLRDRKKIPSAAARFCTIADYVAMFLAGCAQPAMDATMAASLGGYDVASARFTSCALATNDAAEYLPCIIPSGEILAETCEYGKIICACGDNQASVFGTLGEKSDAVCLNVGTGSQVSALGNAFYAESGAEIRPYLTGDYLYVASSLNGGAVYGLLRNFFVSCCEMMGVSAPDNLYALMGVAAERKTHLIVDPNLYGRRGEEISGGSISGLTAENFTAQDLVSAYVVGMAEELMALLSMLPLEIQALHRVALAAGNGLRDNVVLRRCVEEKLSIPLLCRQEREEAAYGAARFAAHTLHL